MGLTEKTKEAVRWTEIVKRGNSYYIKIPEDMHMESDVVEISPSGTGLWVTDPALRERRLAKAFAEYDVQQARRATTKRSQAGRKK
ncbi:MAG: hypothetical protein LBK99_00345 [Opitutaceae bacterium]|jgi:virulence-associated protein VagC|nr:hypothetical protein [Opitutaceae bacterium]